MVPATSDGELLHSQCYGRRYTRRLRPSSTICWLARTVLVDHVTGNSSPFGCRMCPASGAADRGAGGYARMKRDFRPRPAGAQTASDQAKGSP
jgi:hypothetical protein